MAKHQKKAVSVLLSALMIASMCSVPTLASAANTTKEQSNAALSKYYSTNGNGVGKQKSITVDGDISDWDSSMLIAQGTANDDPRVYRDNSMYEVPIDMYAMYAAWDSSNLYLMWEMTNVQDIVAPSDDYPLSQGILYQTMNVPFFIAIDTGKSDVVGKSCQLQTGGTLWDSGITFSGNNVNRVIAVSTNGANGPYVYSGNDTGLNAKEIYTAKTSGIQFKYGLGLLSKNVYGIDKAYGANNNRVLGDMCSDSAAWVDFNTMGHKTSTMDFHYEMAIPLSTLGVSASDITSSGLGIMNVATMGMSGMDCLPYDLSMNDNADQADTQSQEFNSLEKSDPDDITCTFARVGNGDIPVVPTDKPTEKPSETPTEKPSAPIIAPTEVPTEAPTTAAPVTGEKEVTVKEGDTVTFTVDAKTSKKIGGYRITADYPKSALELDTTYSEDGVSTLGAGSGNEVVNTEFMIGRVMSAVLAPADAPFTATNGATLQTMQFVAKKAGTYKISYVIEEMFDDSENDMVIDGAPQSGLTVSENAVVGGEKPTEPETDPVPPEMPTTAATSVTVKKGDIVDYWVEVTIPEAEKLVEGWALDMYYNSSVFEVSKTFADGNMFAVGNAAVDYALGNSTTAVKLPGGTMAQCNFEVDGEASFTDIALGGCDLEGKTTKLVCIQLVAKKDGKGSISYRMRELTNEDLDVVYVDESTYQAKDGAKFAHKVNVTTTADPDVLMGDVNGDGYITKADLSAWMAIYSSKSTPNEYQLAVGDLDGSGKYDLSDRMMLVRLVAG